MFLFIKTGDWRYAADSLFIIFGSLAVLINIVLLSIAKHIKQPAIRQPMQSYPVSTANVAVVGANTTYVSGQVVYQANPPTTVVYQNNPAGPANYYVQQQQPVMYQQSATVVTYPAQPVSPPTYINPAPQQQNYY
jgi:hypothetical protein